MERELKRVDTIARVRRAFHVQGWSMKRISRELHVARNTVRKILRSDETDFTYEREHQPMPRVGPWQEQLDQFLAANEGKPSRERLTLIRIYEEVRALGYPHDHGRDDPRLSQGDPAMIRVEWEDRAVREALARIAGLLTDLTPVMQEIGEIMIVSTQDRMARGETPEGQPFAPRSPVTLNRYARLGLGFGPPLNFSGDLYGSIASDPGPDSVEISSNAVKGAVMQFGAEKHSLGPRSPWGDIPARPYLGVSREDGVNISNAIEEAFRTAFGE
jgi:phage virion morphogenesis protein